MKKDGDKELGKLMAQEAEVSILKEIQSKQKKKNLMIQLVQQHNDEI